VAVDSWVELVVAVAVCVPMRQVSDAPVSEATNGACVADR
jgi:hypothetical protein